MQSVLFQNIFKLCPSLLELPYEMFSRTFADWTKNSLIISSLNLDNSDFLCLERRYLLKCTKHFNDYELLNNHMYLQEMEDRLVELEAMQKVLLGLTGLWASCSTVINEFKYSRNNHLSFPFSVEAYDIMETDLVSTKQKLMSILQSKDRKATVWSLTSVHTYYKQNGRLIFILSFLCDGCNICVYQLLEMVERNELNMSVLTLLDENIASAIKSDQVGISFLGNYFHLYQH